ncbi:MAG TPA: Jag N-terminal domain-containing protein [Candidatus Hydrogenedentes bacterium]|nr:Jag N-terminal domain-containing protein [Candidatus Hydrogenedentota bacterium]
MRQVEAEGKTREEAVEKALRQLGVEMYEVDKVEILDSGSRGIFGWGARPVRVRLTVERLEETPASRSGQPSARRDAPRSKAAPGKQKSTQSPGGGAQPQKQAGRKGPDAGSRAPGGPSSRQEQRKAPQRPQQGANRNDPPAFLKQANNRKQKNGPQARPVPRAASDKPNAGTDQSREVPASPGTQERPAIPGTDTPVASVHHEALEALRRAEQFEQFERGLLPDAPETGSGTVEMEPAEPPMSEEELRRAETVLSELLARMGVEGRVIRGVTEEGGPLLRVETEQSGHIIGKNGRTLESLQYMVNRLITPEAALDCRDRVAVDCQGYLERKWRALREMGRELARRAVASGKIQRTRSMPAQERRVIHLALKDYPDVTTASEGNGYLRCVRVIPTRSETTENARPNRSKSRHGKRRSPRRRPGNSASGQDSAE